MLSFLLDEHLSPIIAEQLSSKRPGISIIDIYRWREGAFARIDDPVLLQAAAEEHLTLITYDLKTIPPILVEWASQGRSHGGIILVDNLTIAPDDFGRLIRALADLWDQQGNENWVDRVVYLRASDRQY